MDSFIAFSTGYDMQMEMKDALTGMYTVIPGEVESLGPEGPSERIHHFYPKLFDRCFFLDRKVLIPCNTPSWRDEHMSGYDRDIGRKCPSIGISDYLARLYVRSRAKYAWFVHDVHWNTIG